MSVLCPVNEVIPEKNIVIFSPHFDDVLFMLGGYINELKKKSLLSTKSFHIVLVFSRSNYLAGTGSSNFDASLERLKLATGKRVIEDFECNDALLGRYSYTYELLGENECFTRGKSFAESEMEFPHGMFEDFDKQDWAILERMKVRIKQWALHNDTALVFPIAFKEHVDHFIVREAAIAIANELGEARQATFYFQEDKPYGGISDEVEISRITNFIRDNQLQALTYEYDPAHVIDLAFNHYISQVEEVYKTGIRQRAVVLKDEMKSDVFCDRIYRLP
jgi:hypothetical protein